MKQSLFTRLNRRQDVLTSADPLLKTTIVEEQIAIPDRPTQEITVPGQVVTPDMTEVAPAKSLSPIKTFATQAPQWLLSHWEVALIMGVLLIAGLAHGINMFHYPYFEDDEGTYMSQGAAVINMSRLAYYTYWYDHAPVGWLQIALWLLLIGGDHTFGSILYSGRILMLLMQLGSTFMAYYIARKISNNVTVAVVAALLFALSPYGLYFHRRVLLDNITTFWMLLSILLLVTGRISLNRVWLSALTLSISMLSKEVTVFLVPVMALLVFLRADKSHRWFALIGWLSLVGLLVSLYPLMAILNNELFPTGTFLGGNAPHVSLLGSLGYQTSRGKDGGIFNWNSGFWIVTRVWIQDDPILVIFGTISAMLSVLVIWKHRMVGILGLLTLSLWLFLARGGEVIKFYLVPLLPLMALNLALMLGVIADAVRTLLQRIPRVKTTVSHVAGHIIIVACVVGIVMSIPSPAAGYGYGSSDLADKNNPEIFWNGTQADAQGMATAWVIQHVPARSRMIIDEYMWSDLYDAGFHYAHYYWKVETDPAIRDTIFHNNWHNFDYVVTTPQMLVDMQTQDMQLVKSAIDNSTPLVHFDTGAWRVEVRKVNK